MATAAMRSAFCHFRLLATSLVPTATRRVTIAARPRLSVLVNRVKCMDNREKCPCGEKVDADSVSHRSQTTTNPAVRPPLNGWLEAKCEAGHELIRLNEGDPWQAKASRPA